MPTHLLVVRAKVEERVKIRARETLGIINLSAIRFLPLSTPFRPQRPSTLIITEGIRCIACKGAKRPYEQSHMSCIFFWESEEAKKVQA
jgi:hypothetical protein